MAYNFDFSYLKKGAPIVTLSSLGIAFNKGAVDLLGAPDRVNVGYDVESHVIGVRAWNESLNAPYYDFAPRMLHDWVRIGAKDFMFHLASETGIDFITKSKQFLPTFDAETKTLLIIVDKEHMKTVKTEK